MMTNTRHRTRLWLLLCFETCCRTLSDRDLQMYGASVYLRPGVFTGWHQQKNVGGKVEGFFRPTNGVSGRIQSVEFLRGLEEVRQSLGRAQADGKRLRAHGSKWSSSNCAYQKEYQIDTRGLNYLKIGFEDEEDLIDFNYRNKKDRLLFVQAGVRIRDLNEGLFEQNLALSTSGATDGQRLVGAIATGTHGSANQYGSMQKFVRGIHVVLPTEEVFIQKSSDRIATNDFAQDWLDGARMIQNDDLFNAVVVGLGAFGVIHGILIEVEPLYIFEVQSRTVSYANAKEHLSTLDVHALGFEGYQPGEVPFDVTFTVNPYRTNESDGVGVRAIRKMAPDPSLEMSGTGQDRNNELSGLFAAIAVIGFVGDWMRRWLYGTVLQITSSSGGEISYQFPNVLFSLQEVFETSSYPEMTGEYNVPIDRIQDAMDIILQTMYDNPYPTLLTLRYLPPSGATLAQTLHGPLTVTIDQVALWDDFAFASTFDRTTKVWDALEGSDIPLTFHWGKGHPERSDWVQRGFGSRVDAWKAQRAKLLDATARELFANDWLEAMGLHDA